MVICLLYYVTSLDVNNNNASCQQEVHMCATDEKLETMIMFIKADIYTKIQSQNLEIELAVYHGYSLCASYLKNRIFLLH